jgi:hypothetical protein
LHIFFKEGFKEADILAISALACGFRELRVAEDIAFGTTGGGLDTSIPWYDSITNKRNTFPPLRGKKNNMFRGTTRNSQNEFK